MMARDDDDLTLDFFFARTDADGVEKGRPVNAQTGGGVLIVGRPARTSEELEATARWMLAIPVEPVFEELGEIDP